MEKTPGFLTTGATRCSWTLLIALMSPLTPALSAACSNGIYITADALGRQLSEDLVRRLDDAHIDHIYVYRLDVSDAAERARLRQAIDGFRKRNQGAKLIGMIGKIASPPTTLARARDLWSLGFDGVQLDFEPVASGDANLIAALALLRKEKPEGKLVGLAGYLIEDHSLPPAGDGKLLLAWEEAYYRQLIALVDDLMVMNYDTGIRDHDDYVLSTSIQTRRLAELAVPGVRLNIGVITNVQGRKGMFDRRAENFSTALQGVREVWPTCPANRGIALFAADGMTEEYWLQVSRWSREKGRGPKLRELPRTTN